MKRFGSIAALVLILAIFIAVNILVGATMRSARLDLTQDKLYTLSEGSRAIARKLDEPIRLTLYYTPEASDGFPQIKSYATRVRELLQEYALASGGKVTLEVVNPEPFTDAEDRAVQAGLSGIPVGGPGARSLYFGLVGTNSTDGQEIIPFFDPSGEQFLEYDVSRLIYALSNPKKKTVGLISSLRLDGTTFDPRSGMPMPGRAWQVLTQLRAYFDVKTLATDIAEIPEGTDALMIVHPKNLPERTLFAIDQYVLGGGRALVFADPFCEADAPVSAQNQFEALMAPRSSDMPELFSAWGLRLEQERLAADLAAGIPVQTGRGAEPVTYIAWLMLRGDNLDKSDAVTGQLGLITMGTAGILRPADGATTTFTPLIHTGDQSMELGVERVRFRADPKELLSGFVPGGKPLTVAARIRGPAKTAFPQGRPLDAEREVAEPAAEPLKQSKGDINVIVVADADMLDDRFWVREETFGPVSLGFRKTADNGDFVLGALDNLTGSSDLIAMRARGRFTRPFEKVEQIQKAAEVRYQAEQAALQAKLDDTQRRLDELQRQRSGVDQAASGGLILTPEQQAEVEKFRKEMLETRKQLRAVQANMRKDIERLGTRLKWANIGLVPAVVAAAALTLGGYRVGRRRQKDFAAEAQSVQRKT